MLRGAGRGGVGRQRSRVVSGGRWDTRLQREGRFGQGLSIPCQSSPFNREGSKRSWL